MSLGEILARIFRGNETNPMRTTHRVSQSSHVVRSRLAELQGSELQRPSEDVAGPLTGWLHAPVSHSLQSQRIVQLCSSHRMDALLAICFNCSSATLLGLSRANYCSHHKCKCSLTRMLQGRGKFQNPSSSEARLHDPHHNRPVRA